MGRYYAYVIGNDGHIQHRAEIICDDDEDAKPRAEQFVDGQPIALWQEACKIETFEPK
jgi:hypothetical protein